MAYGYAEQTTPAKRSTPTLNHRFPLRPETAEDISVDAELTLPRDLTPKEAERIGAWLKTLAVDWAPKGDEGAGASSSSRGGDET